MSAALALWDRVFEAEAPDWETDGGTGRTARRAAS